MGAERGTEGLRTLGQVSRTEMSGRWWGEQRQGTGRFLGDQTRWGCVHFLQPQRRPGGRRVGTGCREGVPSKELRMVLELQERPSKDRLGPCAGPSASHAQGLNALPCPLPHLGLGACCHQSSQPRSRQAGSYKFLVRCSPRGMGGTAPPRTPSPQAVVWTLSCSGPEKQHVETAEGRGIHSPRVGPLSP